jgi:tRNA-modifying protein YgfZ
MTTDYQLLTTASALLDRADRGRIALTGADRAGYLHGILTNDIAALQPGEGCYAAYLTPQGRMISDMQVLNLGDQMLLVVPAGVKDAVLARLEQFIITEDVQVEDRTGRWLQLGVYGPLAPATVAAAVAAGGGDPVPPADLLAGFPDHACGRWAFHGTPLVAARNDELGVPGFDLFADAAQAERLRGALITAGAGPVAEAAAEVLRVEAGRPRFGVDMDEDTIPLEAGIEDRAISFTKGCYVGQEVVIRILHRGQGRVARRLVGLVFEDDVVPGRGAGVSAGEKEIGAVTSAVFSPSLRRALALGYVQRDFREPGTEVQVEGRRAVVSGLPFRRAGINIGLD